MEILKKEQYGEYDEFLRSNDFGHLMQSPMWAELKSNWNYKVIVRRNEEGKIAGSAAMLIRKMPKLP